MTLSVAAYYILYTARQRQIAVTAHFSSKQLRLYDFVQRMKRQIAVTAHISSEQLLLFDFVYLSILYTLYCHMKANRSNC